MNKMFWRKHRTHSWFLTCRVVGWILLLQSEVTKPGGFISLALLSCFVLRGLREKGLKMYSNLKYPLSCSSCRLFHFSLQIQWQPVKRQLSMSNIWLITKVANFIILNFLQTVEFKESFLLRWTFLSPTLSHSSLSTHFHFSHTQSTLVSGASRKNRGGPEKFLGCLKSLVKLVVSALSICLILAPGNRVYYF